LVYYNINIAIYVKKEKEKNCPRCEIIFLILTGNFDWQYLDEYGGILWFLCTRKEAIL
jgi:hypothetical protein